MRELSTSDLDWNPDADGSFETASLVDRHSAFDGTFRSQRDIRVEGDLKGTVTCEGTLFVAEGASVTASVDAEHVSVAGDLSGEVRCRGRLHIMPSGRVRAKVSTASLVIQEGALYEGQLEMAGVERSSPRPLRVKAAVTPLGIDAPSGERQPENGTTYIRRLGSPEAAWESISQDHKQADIEEDASPEDPSS
jgi:cytoskeletal protein CcmA (bactofilin family)